MVNTDNNTMRGTVINFLRRAFPFALAIVLWRLSSWFWNPAGVLALAAVFYGVFVARYPGFGLFGLLICFLVDYSGGTVLFWTTLFCMFYAANGFQTYIDVARSPYDGIYAFMVFFGLGLAVLTLVHLNVMNVLMSVWVFLLNVGMYVPIARLISGVRHDR